MSEQDSSVKEIVTGASSYPGPVTEKPLVIGYLTSMYARATDTFIRSEVLALRDLGHTVHTFSVRRVGDEKDISEEISREQSNTDYLIEMGWGRMCLALAARTITSPGRTFSTIRLAWKVHVPGVFGTIRAIAYVLEAALLAERMQEKGVQHLHNHLAMASATVAMLASSFSGIPYSIKIHGPHIFANSAAQALGEKIVRSDFTACITDFAKSQCMIFTPYAHWHKLFVVPSGMDDIFVKADVTPVSDVDRLVTIGRLSEEKGQAVLLEALHKLKEREIGVMVAIIGDGPLRESLKSLAESLGVEQSVEFLGWQDSGRIREEIEASRAVVVSSFAEGLPQVITEALALGRPVISTRIAGIPELLEDGKSGWLITPGSVASLEEAMIDVLRTPVERLTEMGLHGRDCSLAQHNVRPNVAELASLIRASVESRPFPQISESNTRCESVTELVSGEGTVNGH